MKVSTIVNTIFGSLLEGEVIAEEKVKLLESQQYCKDAFGVYFPVLKRLDEAMDIDEQRKDNKGYSRYYKQPICMRGQRYLLCSEWEKSSKEPLMRWIIGSLND